MVPRKFNVVEFDGFDLAGQYGEALPGIYDKIIDAHWNCVYIMCFGLKFGGFEIAPQYMTPELFSDHIMLNGIISIDRNDVITIPSIEPPPPTPVIISGTFEENGEFNPPAGVDGYAPVTVNVSGNVPVLYSSNGALALHVDTDEEKMVWTFIGFSKGASDVSIPAGIDVSQTGLSYTKAYGSDKTTQIGWIGFYNNKIRSWSIDLTQTLAGTFWGVVYSNGGEGQDNPYIDPPT